MQDKKRATLFQRTVNPLISMGWKNIGAELKQLGEQIRELRPWSIGSSCGTDLLASRGLLPVTSLLLYLITMVLILRLRRSAGCSKTSPSAPNTHGAGWPSGC
jgi:hypothetical protein